MNARIFAADRVLAGPASETIADGAVLVSGELIADVGPRADVAERAGPSVPVTRFPGAAILPGLIDCHVHLAFDAGPDPVGAMRAADDHALLLLMAGHAAQLLDAGVTTVRDLGDRGHLAVRLRDAVAGGTLPGPRILAAGAPVTLTGGHCWFMGGEADGPEEIRAVIRRNLRAGADVVKVMATGGNLTTSGPPPQRQQFTVAELELVVAEARRFGRRVAAHAHGASGIEAALAAGVDTLEHCSFTGAGGVAAGPAPREDLLRAIAASEVYVCPTFSAALARVRELRGEAALQARLGLVRLQHQQGVRLIAGTDAGIPNSRFDAYAEGLAWLARADLPAETIIDMATVTAAAALGIADQAGRLAPGLAADLLVVDGDPVADLGTLARPRLVVAHGRARIPPGPEVS